MFKIKNTLCRVCGKELSECDILNKKRACSEIGCSDIFSSWLDVYRKLCLDGNNSDLTILERKKQFSQEKKLLLDLPNGGFFPLLDGDGIGKNEKSFPTLTYAANESHARIRHQYMKRDRHIIGECDEGPIQGVVWSDVPIRRIPSSC